MANIRKLQENTAALVQNGCSPIRVGGYQRIRIRPSGEFETPHLPSGVRIPDVMAAEQNITSGCKVAAIGCQLAAAGWNGCALPLSGWNDSILSRYVFRMPFDGVSGRPVRIYSLHSGIAYGFQRTLLNLGLLWW